MAKPIEIIVGRGGQYDPAPGTTSVSIPILAGQECYISHSGDGPMDYTSYTISATGLFSLVTGVFSPGDRYYIHLTGQTYSTSAGSFTNGFNHVKVMSALFGRVGWRQPTMSGSPVLSSNNLLSKSGICFQDGHALVTLENIKATLEEVAAGDTALNAYLESLQRSAIMRCVKAVFSEPEFIEQVILFNREGRNDKLIDNTGLFAGYEIEVIKEFDKIVQIDSAVLLFNEDVTFNLYLFKDGYDEPVWQQEVTAEANKSTVVSLDECYLSFSGNDTRGHKYFFGYFQSDLGTAKAYQQQVDDFNNQICFEAEPFYSVASGLNFNRNQYAEDVLPMGLNLEMSSFRDHTQRIVRKAPLFDNAIMLQVAAQVIEQIVFTTRSNGKERKLSDSVDRANAYLDLRGTIPVDHAPTTVGLSKQLRNELERLKKSFFAKPKATVVNVSC